MTLQAAIEAELPFLRAEALGRMTSRVVVMRKTGLTDQDEETGAEVPEWAAVHIDIPFRLGGSKGSAGTRTVTVGAAEVQVATRVGSFAYDTDDLLDGDLIDITSGENAGLVLRIVEADWADQQTARRVPVVSESRPEEW